MVKLTAQPLWQEHTQVDAQTWLQQLPNELGLVPLLQDAAHYAAVIGHDQAGLAGLSCWQQGLSMADSLLSFNPDIPLLIAALLYPAWHYHELDLGELNTAFGTTVTQLLRGTEQMDAANVLHSASEQTPSQIENCRKMLLAMATDLRVVLLKLVERLHALRLSSILNIKQRQQLGAEIMSIYAPLANRLGLGQLKWEMEDLAFRAMDPEAYQTIARQLDMRRIERDAYIQALRQELIELVRSAGISEFDVMGRAKHIYSIHRKISRKGIKLKDLSDISALRILVPTLEACYQVLDLVQQHFSMVEAEFDDYIAQPKANGYQSIHTVVIGPKGHAVEIQIRTMEMHQLAELGVAAHWRYKEGGVGNQSYEAKIAWLRELLSWQHEVEAAHHTERPLLADRIYVFTPQGEIIDLPQGSTPLDFAYTIHTNIGHRCRGAKINGHIVPLTTALQMTDRVEIITGKQAQPSRDWLSTQLKYVTTPRARSKILHWFKIQDFEKNVTAGKSLLEKELKRTHLNDLSHELLAEGFNQPTTLDFYAALGSGALKQGQLASRLQSQLQAQSPVKAVTQKTIKIPDSGIIVEGVGSLLTHPAKCCTPVPGDAIKGYITLRQGVAIHREDCTTFAEQSLLHPEQVLHVFWGKKTEYYPLTLLIDAHDRPGLARDITTVIGHQKINLVEMRVRVNTTTNQARLELTLLISYLNHVDYLLDELKRIPHVIHIQRKGSTNEQK